MLSDVLYSKHQPKKQFFKACTCLQRNRWTWSFYLCLTWHIYQLWWHPCSYLHGRWQSWNISKCWGGACSMHVCPGESWMHVSEDRGNETIVSSLSTGRTLWAAGFCTGLHKLSICDGIGALQNTAPKLAVPSYVLRAGLPGSCCNPWHAFVDVEQLSVARPRAMWLCSNVVRQFWPLSPSSFPSSAFRLLAGIKGHNTARTLVPELQTKVVCLVLIVVGGVRAYQPSTPQHQHLVSTTYWSYYI